MKFNLFGSGKPKNKEKPPKSKAAATQIAELEEQLNDWTDNLKETEQRLQKSSKKSVIITEEDDTSIQSHGPIQELSLEAENTVDEDESDEELEDVNLVEVPPDPTAPTDKEEPTNMSADSIQQLFANDEDEDNPLAKLILSLPEVTIDELEEDLKEIKDIIKDWQKK
jgi:hypothetical protein